MTIAAKKLVSARLRNESLAEALRLKRASIIKGIESQTLNLSERLELLNELRTIFPSDELGTTYLAELQSSQIKKESKNKKFLLLLLLLVPIGVAALYLKQASAPVAETPKLTAPTIAEPALEPVIEKVETLPVVEAPKRVALPEKPATGTIKFIVSEDVDVFVGGQFVSPSRRRNYTIAPGKHLVKLVKDGFVPIENTVTVTAGKASVINVGGL